MCSFIPYAVVALILRLLMAWQFFLDGQTLISGARISQSVYGFDLSVTPKFDPKKEPAEKFAPAEVSLAKRNHPATRRPSAHQIKAKSKMKNAPGGSGTFPGLEISLKL